MTTCDFNILKTLSGIIRTFAPEFQNVFCACNLVSCCIKLHFASIWVFMNKFRLSRFFWFLFFMFQIVAIFRMISQGCHVKREWIVFTFQFSYSYRYDVNDLGTLIGCRTKCLRKESWTKLDLKLFSDNREHLDEMVSQDCYLNWEIFCCNYKIFCLLFVLHFVARFAH